MILVCIPIFYCCSTHSSKKSTAFPCVRFSLFGLSTFMFLFPYKSLHTHDNPIFLCSCTYFVANIRQRKPSFHNFPLLFSLRRTESKEKAISLKPLQSGSRALGNDVHFTYCCSSCKSTCFYSMHFQLGCGFRWKILWTCDTNPFSVKVSATTSSSSGNGTTQNQVSLRRVSYCLFSQTSNL